MDDVTEIEQPPAAADAVIAAGRDAAPHLQNGGLEVVSIAKSYDKRAVLTDISLSVGKGEVLGLLGPNGAGKTTCFYSIMGLVRPDAGRILLDGVDITKLPMYRRAILGLGYLPQETSIFRGMTVEQNINCVLELVEPDPVVRAEELSTSSDWKETAAAMRDLMTEWKAAGRAIMPGSPGGAGPKRCAGRWSAARSCWIGPISWSRTTRRA